MSEVQDTVMVRDATIVIVVILALIIWFIHLFGFFHHAPRLYSGGKLVQYQEDIPAAWKLDPKVIASFPHKP